LHKKVESFSCGSECRRRENAGPVVHAGEETGAKKGESILRGEVSCGECRRRVYGRKGPERKANWRPRRDHDKGEHQEQVEKRRRI